MMDWPLTAAVGTLVVAVGAASVGAVVVLRSEPQKIETSQFQLSALNTTAAYSKPAPVSSNNVNLSPARPGLVPARPGLVPAGPGLVPAEQPLLVPAAPLVVAPASVMPSIVAVAPPSVAVERPKVPLPAVNQEPPKPAKRTVAPPSNHPPPPPKIARVDGVMTGGEIARIRSSLRLTSEQEPLWRPVEAVLRGIGRQQAIQIRNGEKPEVDTSAMYRLYGAAQPLLAVLKPEQKERVRRLARSMGYASVASML